jgi:hypothetical protein
MALFLGRREGDGNGDRAVSYASRVLADQTCVGSSM